MLWSIKATIFYVCEILLQGCVYWYGTPREWLTETRSQTHDATSLAAETLAAFNCEFARHAFWTYVFTLGMALAFLKERYILARFFLLSLLPLVFSGTAFFMTKSLPILTLPEIPSPMALTNIVLTAIVFDKIMRTSPFSRGCRYLDNILSY